MNILMFGDVVGEIGCDCLRRNCPKLKQQYHADLVVVNGENSAAGNGITPQSARQLFDAGADVITTGNHCFRRRCDSLYDDPRILRPANFPDGAPGSGLAVVDMGRVSVAVINLMGTAYMEPLDNPFTVIDQLLEGLDAKAVVVDFHAEATAEKRAMGYYLAGRVSVLAGTHTHVQTADAELLEGGTAYITDLGMTGPMRSVLGVEPSAAIDKQRFHRPVTFVEAGGACMVNGVFVRINDKTGGAEEIVPIYLRDV